jgi:hypothetical protein
MFLIVGELDIDVLKDCLSYLVDRHESLRTTFRIADGRAAQIVHPSGPLHFSSIDVSNEQDPEERAQTLAAEEANNTIDPGILPTTRHLLFKTRQDEHLLARIGHPLAQDAWSFTILVTELTALYEAKLKGLEPPIPKEMPLQYVDYGVWHRELMRADGPVYRETLDWWKEVFAKRMRPIRLPFRRSRSRRLTGVDHKLGVIGWKIDNETAQRLDRFARDAGATHFVVRLACCVALIGDVTGRANVVLGTFFANRRRMAARNIVGQLSTLAPLVLRYDPKSPFRAWIKTVRDRLYETETHAEITYEELCEQLRVAGLKPPGVRLTFFMGSDLAEQHFGDLTLTRISYPIGTMPWGCQFYVDERNPENCRVDFNANLYDRNGMQALVDRYVRLLEIGSRQPELTIGRLVALSSDSPLRRAIASYATRRRKRIAAG